MPWCDIGRNVAVAPLGGAEYATLRWLAAIAWSSAFGLFALLHLRVLAFPRTGRDATPRPIWQSRMSAMRPSASGRFGRLVPGGCAPASSSISRPTRCGGFADPTDLVALIDTYFDAAAFDAAAQIVTARGGVVGKFVSG
jgi:hypothetical protein